MGGQWRLDARGACDYGDFPRHDWSLVVTFAQICQCHLEESCCLRSTGSDSVPVELNGGMVFVNRPRKNSGRESGRSVREGRRGVDDAQARGRHDEAKEKFSRMRR